MRLLIISSIVCRDATSPLKSSTTVMLDDFTSCLSHFRYCLRLPLSRPSMPPSHTRATASLSCGLRKPTSDEASRLSAALLAVSCYTIVDFLPFHSRSSLFIEGG